jgi:hypothetical protein
MNFIQTGFRGKNNWWMYVFSTLMVLIAINIGTIPLFIVAFVKAKGNVVKFIEAAENTLMTMGMNSNLFLFLMILGSVFGLLGLYLCVKLIHKKKFKGIVTSRRTIDWKRVFTAFFIWFLLCLILIGVGIYLEPELYTWNFKPIPFFILLGISLVFFPFQTSLEELIFRGYLMQAFGQLAKNKWFPLLFTSVVFGLLHVGNPEIEKIGYIALVFYIGTGLLFGIITLMDEGTEISLGLHAANNIMGAVFVTADWAVFQTDALFVDTSEPSVNWEMFFPVFVIYPLILLLFSKIYGWSNWSEKLFGKVEKPFVIEES